MSILSKIQSVAIPLTIFGGLQFVILTFLAMLFYPGGTVGNPLAEHYIFFENFFSDLGRTQDFENNSNLISRILFTISLSLQGVLIILFFYTIPTLFPKDKKTKRWTFLIALLGMIAGIGFIGIAHTPWDLDRPIHVFFVNLGFRLLLLSTLLTLVRIYKTDYFPNIYGHVLSFVCIILLGYVLLLIFGPAPESSREGLILQVTCQKIVVYLLIIGITILAYGSMKVQSFLLNESPDYKEIK